MALNCPPGTICPDKPYTANVGASGTKLFFYTSTKVTQDSSGKVNGGQTTLFYSSTPGNYVPAATTNDGGKTWNYLKDSEDKFILGDDARRSLQEGVLKTNTNNVIKESAVKGGIPEVQAKTLQLNQNTASSNAPTAGDNQEGQGNTKAEEFNADKLLTEIKDAGVREKYDARVQYPIDAKFDDQDCIKFSMFRYTPKKFSVTPDLGGFSGSNKGSPTPMGSVILPIQPQISDANVVSWGEDSLSALQALAGAAALAGIVKGGEAVGETMEQITTALADKGKSGDIKAGLAAHFAGQAAGANQGFFTRATGAVLNNNLELLFQGPSLRSFTFTFSLSARYKEESQAIRKIIRFFKQGMSVKRSTSALFLKTPNIFDIEYLHKGQSHPYINQIKTCALQNFVVNYTPGGNYATFEDGAMTQYDLNLTFGEIEPIFDDDYGNADTKIGY